MRWFIKDLLIPIAVAIALALVIQGSIAKPYEIPTESMVPTIQANDRIIANRLIYRFRDISRGDVIVFHPTDSAKATCGDVVSDVPFVKRVIGLPGDRVEVRNGQNAPLQLRVNLQPGETMAIRHSFNAPAPASPGVMQDLKRKLGM